MLDVNLSSYILRQVSDRRKQADEFDRSIFPTLMGKKWATYQQLRDIVTPNYVIYACWPDQSAAAFGGWDSCIICGIQNLRTRLLEPARRPHGELTIRVPDEAAGREIGEVLGDRFGEGGFSRPRRNAPGIDDGRMLRILVPDYRATGPDGGHGWRTHYVPT